MEKNMVRLKRSTLIAVVFCLHSCASNDKDPIIYDSFLKPDLGSNKKDVNNGIDKSVDFQGTKDRFPDKELVLDALVIPNEDGPCGFYNMCNVDLKTKKACCCGTSTPSSSCCPKSCAMMPVSACLVGTKICLDFCSSCVPPGWK